MRTEGSGDRETVEALILVFFVGNTRFWDKADAPGWANVVFSPLFKSERVLEGVMSKKGKKGKRSANRADRRKGLKPQLGTEDLTNVVGLFGDPLFEEFAEYDEDHEDMHALVCQLWNLAVLKSRSQQERFDDLESALVTLLGLSPFRLPPGQAMNLIDVMVKRWNAGFTSQTSLIVDHWIEEDDDQIYCVAMGRRLPDAVTSGAGDSADPTGGR